MVFSLSATAVLGVGLAAAAATGAERDLGRLTAVATLDPIQVVPSVSSVATGRIEVEVDPAAGTFRYALEIGALEGVATQAHLHFGQRVVNGGIVAWLCGSAADGEPVETPRCPAAPGRIEGVITASQVLGPAGQGIAPGQFQQFLEAFGSGHVYVDVHSTGFAGGELRGQLLPARLPAGTAAQ
jgi:hypothetical protein